MRAPPADRRAGASSGFTLIEVIVALAIAALGLGALMAATGTGLENASAADQYIQATGRAQSRLAQVGVTTPLRPGEYSGDDGAGYRWRIRISPPARADAATLALYPVRVTISWRGGGQQKSLSLYSERAGRR